MTGEVKECEGNRLVSGEMGLQGQDGIEKEKGRGEKDSKVS